MSPILSSLSVTGAAPFLQAPKMDFINSSTVHDNEKPVPFQATLQHAC